MIGQGKLTELLQTNSQNHQKHLIKYGLSKKLNVRDLCTLDLTFKQVKKRLVNITPLHIACCRCEPKVVEVLLEEGWDVNYKDKNIEFPLWLALDNGNIPVARLLIQKGADVMYSYREMTLMAAALSLTNNKDENICIEGAKFLLDAGISVNAKVVKFEESAIHMATHNNHTKVLQFLLENGADINAATYNGDTALHIATSEGNLDFMKALMNCGADLYIKNSLGDSVLHIAVKINSKQAVKALKEGGFNTNDRSYQFVQDCLKLSVRQRNVEMVELLIDLGSHPKFQRNLDSVLISLINPYISMFKDKKAEQADKEIAKLLVEKGANINLSLCTASLLCVAVISKSFELAKLFIRLGAKVNTMFGSETTLFHRVVTLNYDIIELFLEYGGDYNSLNRYGETPYNKAISCRADLKFIKYFVKFGCPFNQNLKVWNNLEKRLDWQTRRFFFAEKKFFEGIENNDIKSVREAVKEGAVVNGCSEEMKYPVHFLASNGYAQLLEYLLSEGVSPNTLNDKKKSPLYLAANFGHYDCCCTLLKFGACYTYPYEFRKSVKNTSVKTLLQHVDKIFKLTCTGHKRVITNLNKLRNKNITEYLMYANARNHRGDSLIAVALYNNHTFIAKELLKLFIK